MTESFHRVSGIHSVKDEIELLHEFLLYFCLPLLVRVVPLVVVKRLLIPIGLVEPQTVNRVFTLSVGAYESLPSRRRPLPASAVTSKAASCGHFKTGQ